MEEKISSFLKAIQADTNDIALCDEVMNFLSELFSEEIVPVKESVAALFCETLAVYQANLDEKELKSKSKKVKKAFSAIAQMTAETPEQSDGNLAIMSFLNKLYTRREEEKIEMNFPDKTLKALLPELKNIRFIFKMEDETGKIFPIHRLLADVISDQKFLNTAIEPYHIYMLQLAVELFENVEEKECVNQLKKDCNLKFIDYINGAHQLIDTVDMLNYAQNGVMIFYNPDLRSVLIRQEHRNYFQEGVINSLPYKCEIEEEKNYEADTIGYFVRLPMEEESIKFMDFSDAIREDPEDFLRLLYDRKCKNVFLEHSIIKKNGTLAPINPFCISDKKLVKGKRNGKNGKVYENDEILNLLRKYRMHCVIGDGIDRVTLGLCISLLEKDNIGAETLLNSEHTGKTWRQNELIRNWVEASSDKQGAFQFVLEMWLRELEYADNDLKDFKLENFGYVYPYPFDLEWAYDFLNFSTTEPAIYSGEVIINEEKRIGVDIQARRTLAGKSPGTPGTVFKEEIVLPGTINESEYFVVGSQHFLYRSKENAWCGDPELDNIYKMTSEIEKKQNHLLNGNLRTEVHETQVSVIVELMKLNEDALMAVGHNKLSDDFESMAVCRLIHNLIWNNITKDRWGAYFKILNMHQKLSFEDIGKDDNFRVDIPGTLYVMKDNAEQDAVLNQIYNRYLKKANERDPGPFSRNKLSKNKNGKFCLDKEEIRQVVFLFDTLESGTATIRTMACYLGMCEEWKALNENQGKDGGKLEREIKKYVGYLQTYLCNEEEISVQQIIERNEPQIVVHSYYGTDEGIERVRDFLKKWEYEGLITNIDYYEKINAHKAVDVEKECREIWPDKKDDLNFYMVVREFNMTKRNVFPDEMCGDVTNAICMFVKKAERS